MSSDLLIKVINALLFDYSDGENWHEQRRPISKFMMMPRKVAEYHEPFNEVTFDLVKKIKKNRDESGNLIDASSYLYKWSFECEWDVNDM